VQGRLEGNHLSVRRDGEGCARSLAELATAEECAVSAVQPTREGLLPSFGAIGGQPLPGRPELYRIDTVLEKPTLTEAERKLIVPGLRAGHYLCFFGMHVLTATVFDILGGLLAANDSASLSLSAALAELARREKYLALEKSDRRYDLGARYGLFAAQLALALAGCDRDEVLSQVVELLAMREMESVGR
jgi:UTP--glucose-1-phosphate uridylyltransferase